MDLMRSRVALRERPLLDVFDLAVRLCALHARAYAVLGLAVLTPCFALSCGAARLGGWWLGWAVTVALSALATTPFVALSSRLVFADRVRAREALGAALRALPRVLVLRAVQLVLLVLSLMFFGLPWLWLGSVTLFVVEVVVLEHAGIATAFGRAQRVAGAHFASAATAMLLLVLAPVGAAMLADAAGRELLQGVLEIRPPASMFQVGGSWLALAGWWATLPLLTTARLLVYLDVRTRTEGWDIQTRFAAIAARAAEATRELAA